MYSKAETAKVRKDFWTTFGQYMNPVPAADGGRVNWQNYKTGVRNIFFRMKAERDFTSLGIEITHSDEEMQELVFDQFRQFRNILQTTVGQEWEWQLHTVDEYGKTISTISIAKSGPNVMDRNDWPEIISFLKPRIIALDEFWSNMKPAFEDF